MQITRRSGFSLPQVLVGMVIGLGVILVAGQFLVTTKKSGQELTARITATSISTRVKKSIVNLSVLKYSSTNGTSPGNARLRECLDPLTSDLCRVTTPNAQVSFEAIVPTRGSKNFHLAGTADASRPVFYTVGGAADCNPSNDPINCPGWRVNAYFWARCGSGEATCKQATTIMVRFQVMPASALQAKQAHAWPDPTLFNSDKEKFAFPIRVRDTLMGGQECPPGSIASGYTDSGALNCGCATGYVQVGLDGDGHPICQPGPGMQCGDTERVVGINTDGTPKCAPVSLQEQCQRINFEDANTRCPSGWWLRTLNMGSCTTGGASKKSRGEIKCSRNRGQCCREVIR